MVTGLAGVVVLPELPPEEPDPEDDPDELFDTGSIAVVTSVTSDVVPVDILLALSTYCESGFNPENVRVPSELAFNHPVYALPLLSTSIY